MRPPFTTMLLRQADTSGGSRATVLMALLLVATLCLLSALWLVRLEPPAAAVKAAEAERERLRRQVAELEQSQKTLGALSAGMAPNLAQVWLIPPGKKAEAQVMAGFQSLLRSAQVKVDQSAAPRVSTLPDLSHIQAVEFDVSIAASMGEISRLLAEMEKTAPPFFWHTCAIGPINARDSRAVRLQGRLAALCVADDAAAGAFAGIVAGPSPGTPAAASADEMQELWQRSLFAPERTEEPVPASTAAKPETRTPASEDVDMELVGLARMGENSVATILTTSRRRPITSSRAPTTGSARGGHFYRVGDAVGGTGYVVKAISFEENGAGGTVQVGRVVLARGAEELVLAMDPGDAQSAKRRTEGVPAPSRRLPVRAATGSPGATGTRSGAAVAREVAPPPPPPLPAASSPSAGATPSSLPAVMTREERLERARQLRERILQGRAAQAPPSN